MSKVILVTGANTGIGFELARLLAQKGNRVSLAARKEAAGKEAADQLNRENLDVRFVRLDVNAVTPGFTSTKLNFFGEGGKSTREGAEILVPWDGPTCQFIDEKGERMPW
ncbi:hypothetical protein AX15_002466 [Amanita polypyramis BW_CC]|nr:hypothetical protein AX15_002466 [Amanita polypyramis BW_CC]